MSAAGGGGGVSQDVTIRLRLVPDDANKSAVDRFKADADKIRKEFEKGFSMGGGNKDSGASKGFDDYSKKMVAGMSAASDKMVNINQRANDRIKAGFASVAAEAKRQADKEAAAARKAAENKIADDNRVMQNRIKMVARVAQAEKQKEADAKRVERQGITTDRQVLRSEMMRERMVGRGVHGVGEIAGNIGAVTQGVMMFSAGNENLEKMAQSVMKIGGAFEAMRGGLGVLMGINDSLLTMRRYAAAAAVEQRALAAARGVAAAGSMAGAAGSAGMGGAAATYLGGAAAGLGTAAGIAGVGVGLVAAGAAVQEAVSRLVFGTEGTASAMVGWWKASEDAAKSTRELAFWEQSRADRLKRQSEMDTRAQQEGEARGKLIEGNRQTYHIHGMAGQDFQRAQNLNDAIASARSSMAGKRKGAADVLGLKELPPIERNAGDMFMNRAALADAQRRLPNANRIVQGLGFKTIPAPTLLEAIEQERKAAPNKFSWRGMTHGMRGIGKWWGGSETQVPVDTGPMRDTGKQVAVYTEILNAQKAVTGEAQKEYELLQQRGNQLKEMVVSGKSLVDQSNEAVKAAHEQSTAYRAHLSLLTAGQQHAADEALKHVMTGKGTRGDRLLLNELGVNHGKIGKKLNEDAAKDLDQGLSESIHKYGGDEDEDKAKNDHVKLLTEMNRVIQKSIENETNINDAREELLKSKKAQDATSRGIADVQAHQGGYTLDASGVAGTIGDIKRTGAEWNPALRQMGDEFVAVMKSNMAEMNRIAQRLKGMHN